VTPWRKRLGPLEERTFLLLFAGRTISFFGSALAPVALAFAVLDLTGSASDLGIVLTAFAVPQVLFMLLGGIWGDRLPRHLVMVVTDIVSGAVQVATAVLLLTGTAEIWQLAALQAIRGTASAFFFPAMTGIVPETVSAPRLQQANAILGVSRNASQIGGAALGGVLVAFVGSGWALAIDAATYFVGAGFLAVLRLPRNSSLPERNFVRELREGWDEFRSRTWLWAIVLQFSFMVPCFVGAVSVLGPAVAQRDLGGAAAWGMILASQALGMVAGGVVMLRYKPSRPLLVATLAMLPPVAFFLALALPAPTVVVAAAAFVAGFGFDVFGVLWNTALHEHIPPAKLARVSSYDALGSFVFAPVGLAVAGPIADEIGMGETLVGSAMITLVATLAVLLSRDVRTLPSGRPQPLETPAIAAR
jgi:MFS family permease